MVNVDLTELTILKRGQRFVILQEFVVGYDGSWRIADVNSEAQRAIGAY